MFNWTVCGTVHLRVVNILPGVPRVFGAPARFYGWWYDRTHDHIIWIPLLSISRHFESVGAQKCVYGMLKWSDRGEHKDLPKLRFCLSFWDVWVVCVCVTILNVMSTHSAKNAGSRARAAVPICMSFTRFWRYGDFRPKDEDAWRSLALFAFVLQCVCCAQNAFCTRLRCVMKKQQSVWLWDTPWCIDAFLFLS